jgi:hypothetical protein
MGAGIFALYVMQVERKAVQVLASGVEVKNEWKYTSGFLYGFVAWIGKDSSLLYVYPLIVVLQTIRPDCTPPLPPTPTGPLA